MQQQRLGGKGSFVDNSHTRIETTISLCENISGAIDVSKKANSKKKKREKKMRSAVATYMLCCRLLLSKFDNFYARG